MLQLSVCGDYGLLLLLELAKQPAGRYISLAKFTRDKGLPRRFLDQVARQLLKAGLIKAREGRAGGYALSKRASAIKFIKVLKALEGEISRRLVWLAVIIVAVRWLVRGKPVGVSFIKKSMIC